MTVDPARTFSGPWPIVPWPGVNRGRLGRGSPSRDHTGSASLEDIGLPVSPSWPLVGRNDELELAERAMSKDDEAGIVVAGAAGVGKSRLAREFLDRVSVAGRSTAWVQATGSARGIPFGA